MRKFAKILIPALLLIAIVVSCTVLFSSAADENVIYVAAEAKGDGTGSSPENAMGHDTYSGTINHSVSGDKTFDNRPYQEVVDYIYGLDYGTVQDKEPKGSRLFQKNVLYKAFNALVGKGGTIVIMEELGIEVMTKLKNQDTADNDFPASSNTVTLTSNYGGVDYRTQGAKFVLNASKWNNVLWDVGCPIVMKDLNVEHRYTTKYTQTSWEQGISIYARGNDFTVDTGVTVTSVAYDDNMNATPGTVYPNIFAGRRYQTVTGNPVITIKSGTWRGVFASGHGNTTNAYPASLTGNVTINVEGGKVETINGGGSVTLNRDFTQVIGDLAINVTGGEVGTITAATSAGVTGDVDITVKTPAKVSSIAPTTADASAKTIEVKYDEGSVELITNTDKFTDVNPPFNSAPTPPSTPENVIYVAATAKGDGTGSSPENAMGHDTYSGTINHSVSGDKTFDNRPYQEVVDYIYGLDYGTVQDKQSKGNRLYQKNVLYKAFNALAGKGGTIVIMEELGIEVVTKLENQGTADNDFPESSKTVTLTSNYGGVDYRTQGAKFVLNASKWNNVLWDVGCPLVMKDLNVEHRYTTEYTQEKWEQGVSIYARGYDLTVDTGVTVTSVAYDKNMNATPGTVYPNIFAGRRYQTVKRNPVITIKSGTWRGVFASGHGNTTNAYPASLTGNVTINVEGGKVETINGGGSITLNRDFTQVIGDLAINVTGGEVGTITAATSAGVTGDVDITVKTPAKVDMISAKTANATAKTIDLTYVEGTVGFINVEGFTNVDPPFDTNVEPPFNPNLQQVIYISANGTGDGSSPESPLGNAPGYKENLQKMYDLLKSVGGYGNVSKLSEADQTFVKSLYKDNVLYRAYEKANKKDTVIVLVGDIAVDIVSGRMTYRTGEKLAPAEFTLPASIYNVTITSVYGGHDYRNQAKFILDLATCNTTNLTFKAATTIENINIEHRYNNDDKNGWSTPFVFAANCYKFVIGENVNVTSFDTSTNSVGAWYPGILGGHRYENKTGNANVTIKSGTWSIVHAGSYGNSGTYGKITGNATLNIEGGKIEAVYGTSSLSKPTASITKKLTINITGGFVEALYATAKNGAKNEIIVNIAKTAERVAKAWGGISDANIPANATINYDRSVTRDDEVKYWTTVNYTGNVEAQPEPYLFTLYIANVSKGKGDGSSPENAMGHAEGYDKLRKQALDIIAANGGTNTGITAEQKTIVNSVYPKNALYRALTYAGNKIVNQGGKIVVCGTLTVDATDAMRKSLADFWTPSGAETITITSYDGTTNFRNKGAKLILDTADVGLCVEFDFPVTFDNLTIEHKYNSKNGKSLGNVAMIAGRGNRITVGYNVNVIATDVNPDEEARVDLYPVIVGGHRYSDSKADCYVTVGSGQWGAVVGGDWGSAHTGNATIGINGGKIGTVCGTINPTNSTAKNIFNGSVWIGLWAGEVDNVYVVGKPGMIWGDASIGLGGTKINGKVRATHPDYEGKEIQAWVFNYTDAQVDTTKVVGFENPVPDTGSSLPYLAVVASVSLVGAAALIVSKKKKAVKN